MKIRSAHGPAQPTESNAASNRGAPPTSYPPARAFVVQFLAGDAGLAQLSGRAEHVVTGKSARFSSTTELFEFLRSVLLEENSNQPRVDSQ